MNVGCPRNAPDSESAGFNIKCGVGVHPSTSAGAPFSLSAILIADRHLGRVVSLNDKFWKGVEFQLLLNPLLSSETFALESPEDPLCRSLAGVVKSYSAACGIPEIDTEYNGVWNWDYQQRGSESI